MTFSVCTIYLRIVSPYVESFFGCRGWLKLSQEQVCSKEVKSRVQGVLSRAAGDVMSDLLSISFAEIQYQRKSMCNGSAEKRSRWCAARGFRILIVVAELAILSMGPQRNVLHHYLHYPRGAPVRGWERDRDNCCFITTLDAARSRVCGPVVICSLVLCDRPIFACI